MPISLLISASWMCNLDNNGFLIMSLASLWNWPKTSIYISMSRLWLQQQFLLALLWDWPKTSIYILTSRQWFRQLWSCYCTYLPPLAALSVGYLVDQPARLGDQFTHIVLSPACITPVKANKYYVEQGIVKLTDSTLIPLLSYFPCVFISWLKTKYVK